MKAKEDEQLRCWADSTERLSTWVRTYDLLPAAERRIIKKRSARERRGRGWDLAAAAEAALQRCSGSQPALSSHPFHTSTDV